MGGQKQGFGQGLARGKEREKGKEEKKRKFIWVSISWEISRAAVGERAGVLKNGQLSGGRTGIRSRGGVGSSLGKIRENLTEHMKDGASS